MLFLLLRFCPTVLNPNIFYSPSKSILKILLDSKVDLKGKNCIYVYVNVYLLLVVSSVLSKEF